LFFFPVDNTASRDDIVMKQLLVVVEDTMLKSDGVNQQIPLCWLKLLDAMMALGKSLMPLTEVIRIAAGLGVPEGDVRSFLTHMSKIGVLLWHDEPLLKVYVILLISLSVSL
jgi:hypothetical protein